MSPKTDDRVRAPTPAEAHDNSDSDVDADVDKADANDGLAASTSDPSAKKKSKKKKKKRPAEEAAAAAASAATADGNGNPPPPSDTAAVAAEKQPVVPARAQPRDEADAAASNAASMSSLMAMLQAMSADQRSGASRGAKSMDDHKFWRTQPVPRADETIEADGEIEPSKPRHEVRQTPYELTAQFEWSNIDINDDVQIKEVYELLCLNYVEDDDAMFRFDYSADFLKWALQPPGWKRSWHVGVRVASNKKLVAFISGIPTDLNVRGKVIKLVEINFLCVHKKLRSKRLAPILIKEVTRLVHLEGIFQAVYTAGVLLPKPISVCRYQHRSLNPKKLIECKFSSLSPKLTMAGTIKLYKLPESPLLPGTMVMEAKHVPAVTKLLKEYLSQFAVAPSYSEDEVRHWMLTQKGVVYSFVVEDPTTHTVTDFYSFYSLPSSVIGNAKHTHINAAYLFYYAPRGNGADASRTQALLKDALIQARRLDFDVFNCLDIMHNAAALKELKFGVGDGRLHYYLYNYRCRDVAPADLGLVLL
ncbi:Myristoyl-CoA:protein N-myristoyltransferase, N-terminal domain-containing protein [Zopfochytrium polystomum]|nr:Myristoyl-CoA:protein N-myristoyltransferase, N-terminal domain-containing protein [Zopfochytrium polystomum]